MKADAYIVTRDFRYYPMTRYEANRYLVDHNITDFRISVTGGIIYFYIKEEN